MKLLVVDASDERRAQLVDALCELPGIEVQANARDASHAIRLLDTRHFDAMVTAGVLPDGAAGMLISRARARAVRDIIVLLGAPQPPAERSWIDLGARHVVASLEDVVEQATALVEHRTRERGRQRVVAQPATLEAQPSASPMSVTSAISQRATRRADTDQVVDLGELLRDTLAGLGRFVLPEVQLVLEVPEKILHVRCVPRDIEQLALHLVLDACEAIPLGGKVWLFVEREGPSHVRIEVLDSGGNARGPGIANDLIRSAVERQGGEIRIVRRAGGTTSLQIVLRAIVEPPS